MNRQRVVRVILEECPVGRTSHRAVEVVHLSPLVAAGVKARCPPVGLLALVPPVVGPEFQPGRVLHDGPGLDVHPELALAAAVNSQLLAGQPEPGVPTVFHEGRRGHRATAQLAAAEPGGEQGRWVPVDGDATVFEGVQLQGLPVHVCEV